MEKAKMQTNTQHDYGSILVVVTILIILIAGAESARLTCERAQETGAVSCTRQLRLWWLIPLRTTAISDVQGALVSETTDYEGDTTYRVELYTPQGNLPLTSMYSSGYSTKREVSDAINNYVNGRQRTPLELTEPGFLSAENMWCMAIWLPFYWGMRTLWKSFKSRR